MTTQGRPPHLAILAGGASKRMRNGRPKALQSVFFKPMVQYVLDSAMALPHRSISLVVGRGEEELRELGRGYPELLIARQETPLGSADAVRTLESFLGGQEGDVLILAGDAVLLTPGSLRELLARHAAASAACTAGRAASGEDEPVAYCFRLPDLFKALKHLSPSGPGGEFRLSDAAAGLAAAGAATADYVFPDANEAADVNDFLGVWRVEALLQERFNRDLMLKGTALQDPRTTLIDPRCRIERDVRIEAGCTVIDSVLEAGVVAESFCRIAGSEIGAGSRIRQGSCVEEARVGRDCRVGPYAHLRPGTRLDDAVRLGNFVEVKNASLGAGTRAAHLSFIGDASVGRNVMLGCGFITCNSTGRPLKQRTVIGDDVFVGSASQAIAPVTLGAGSFIATGSTVTDDVPPDSFVISRGRQVVKPGYAKKYAKPKDAEAPR
ncbi:MAG: NTP transferase domain-containing protein [Elusimicrobiota bacterium]